MQTSRASTAFRPDSLENPEFAGSPLYHRPAPTHPRSTSPYSSHTLHERISNLHQHNHQLKTRSGRLVRLFLTCDPGERERGSPALLRRMKKPCVSPLRIQNQIQGFGHKSPGKTAAFNRQPNFAETLLVIVPVTPGIAMYQRRGQRAVVLVHQLTESLALLFGRPIGAGIPLEKSDFIQQECV